MVPSQYTVDLLKNMKSYGINTISNYSQLSLFFFKVNNFKLGEDLSDTWQHPYHDIFSNMEYHNFPLFCNCLEVIIILIKNKLMSDN